MLGFNLDGSLFLGRQSHGLWQENLCVSQHKKGGFQGFFKPHRHVLRSILNKQHKVTGPVVVLPSLQL